MDKRNLSAFVGLATLVLITGATTALAQASTGWASSAGGYNDTPVRVPSAVLLIVFALAVAGGLFLLLRKPSGPSALQEWFHSRHRAEG